MRRRHFVASLLALPGYGTETGPRVYVQNVTERGATLCWSGAAGEVGYSAAGEDSRTVSGLVKGRRVEARLEGLSPGTEYAYRVLGASGVFRTAGAGRTAFLVLGDTGTGSAEQAALADRLVKERAQFLLHTGDVAYPTGQAAAYADRYLDYYHALMGRTPFFPCPGNHDYYETRAEPYFAFHDLPAAGVPAAEQARYYTFDWGDGTVVSIDSNEPLEDPARRAVMLDWLDRTLEASARFWRIVFFHHPPLAAGPNEGDALTELARQYLVPVLERHRVPLVFNGHEHSYQRSIPVGRAETTYITTGGGGAPLYPVGASRNLAYGASVNHYLRAEISGYGMDVTAVGIDGAPFDATRLRPGPMLRTNGVVNAASFTTRIGRGSAISLFGWQLGITGTSGVAVRANGVALELLAVTPKQVNAVLPGPMAGRVQLVLTSPNGTAEAEIEVMPVAPALFPIVERRGSAVRVYATGMAGFAEAVSGRISGILVDCRLGAGPVAGVQEVEFTLPAEVEGELTITAEGESSNAITVALG